ncbi:MAG TPA: lysine-2,3-aminomutase-like protein [Alphaproteobacteria bacterium]|nr:lysine-2,3-aminomutase-like protein [Rhodospirillaceae bacterium]HRJ66089.1 lysine-2,3-aminomutase-like protein [Alphaproteobacteria bacterium]
MQAKKRQKADISNPTNDPAIAAVMERYAVSVTDHVLSAMQTHDTATDPVARQYLPAADELVNTPEELDDPIGDDAHSPVKGIVHRYPDRVLLKPVHVCAVYCRFCFRREKVGPGSEALSADELAAAIDYIKNAPQVWEVILTGGDPFVLSARRLRDIMTALNAIPHVQVIRFHTRVPVADPVRITDDVIAALESEKAVYVVLHANHAQELTGVVKACVRKFLSAGIPLLSQSALLRGVNDKPEVLENLFRTLTAMKVKPYYLHHPDLAPGTSHFRLTIAEGQDIMRRLQGRVSGVALPRYVLDIPGGHGKVPVEPRWIEPAQNGDGYTVQDYRGNAHPYEINRKGGG